MHNEGGGGGGEGEIYKSTTLSSFLFYIKSKDISFVIFDQII